MSLPGCDRGVLDKDKRGDLLACPSIRSGRTFTTSQIRERSGHRLRSAVGLRNVDKGNRRHHTPGRACGLRVGNSSALGAGFGWWAILDLNQ